MKNKEAELEKIRKLINSEVFGDRYIGIKVLDNLPQRTAAWVMQKLGSEYSKTDPTTWFYSKGKEIELPEEYNEQYIIGKNYAYSINTHGFMADNKVAYKKTVRMFGNEDAFKIVENWRDN